MEVPQVIVSSPTRHEGKDLRGDSVHEGGQYVDDQSGYAGQSAPPSSNENDYNKMRLPVAPDTGAADRRPRPSGKFDLPIGMTPTVSTNGETSRSSRSSNAHSESRGLWKVKLAGGGYLDSSSYNSLHENNVHSNATEMLRRLKLNNLNGDDEDERDSSTATTKVSNFTFQKKIQKRTLNRSLSAAYYRPVDSLEQSNGGSSASPPPPSPSRPSKFGSSKSKSNGNEACSTRRDGVVLEPSHLSVAFDRLPSGMSSLSYSSSEDNTKVRTPYNNIPIRSPHCLRKDMRQMSLVQSASESDDDSVFKRMESVTHNFQRNGASDLKHNKRNSAVPLSGIGVDVRNDYNTDERYRIRTPREAANASCSISSIMGEVFGLTPPKDENRSPFNIVRDIICSPDRMRSAPSSGRKENRQKPAKADVSDDWSVDNEVRSEYNDERSYSHAPSESCRRSGTYRKRRSANETIHHNRKSVGRGTLQEKYDKSLSYRHYHREDFSYYGTEAGSTYYQPSRYSCADENQSDVSGISGSFQQRARYRDSPFVRRLKNRRLDDQYEDDETSY